MNRKISQLIMVWLLPVIIIEGLIFPVLGYIVFFMILFFLVLSYFKSRFWCSHLCPRGAFLDLILSKVSLKKRIPPFLSTNKFRWSVVAMFMVIFILQFILSPINIVSVGFIFVRMCLITTLIAIVLGIPIHQRTWCAFCPMGTLQSKIGSLNKNKK